MVNSGIHIKAITVWAMNLLIGSACLFVSANLKSQDNYILTPVEPTNYQIHYDDLWRISIVTPTVNSSQHYYLVVKVSQGDHLVWEAQTFSFTIDKTPHWILPDRLNRYKPIENTIRDRRWFQNMQQGGGQFPPGQYTIKYQLVATNAQCTIAGQLLAHYQYNIHVKSLQPPALLSPEPGDTIRPSALLFSWAPAFTTLPQQPLRYTLRVARVNDHQSPTEAITNNTPLYISEEHRQTQAIYPEEAPPLTKGKRYAWQVGVYNSKHLIAYSSVWSFVVPTSPPSLEPTLKVPALYYELSTSIGDDIYTVTQPYIFFKYTADYNNKSTQLKYELKNRNTGEWIGKGSTRPLSVEEGYNTYDIGIGKLAKGQYLLKVTDPKSQTSYLLFHYQPK